MNADLQGLWDAYFGKNKAFRNCNIIVTDKGKTLKHHEAEKYIKYCMDKGFKELKDCPEYEEIFN